MKVLVTGGAGYIGSHTCVELMQAGHEVVIFDNLSNSYEAVIGRIARIAGRAPEFTQADVRDSGALREVFIRHRFDAVIHFAGLKAVGESVEKPIEYYDNNVHGALVLCRAMAQAGVGVLVFSSSATVYGNAASVPIREDAPLEPTNPYGHSKLMVERILQDLEASDPGAWRIALLRYFNPVGAHPSGLIGEDPQGIPNNLMPNIAQVAVGIREKIRVFGSDYPTRDGTGVRDYIHVVDLARGHLAALETMQRERRGMTVNLGTGRGVSVLETVRAFERASGRTVPFERVARRAGDVAECYADPSLAEKILGWKATYTLEDMCRDTWRWQSMNPHGYREESRK
ncbi:MAG: UDP-glucose 4-epimerase GalE [Betaproteobacteria bacterium]|nr:MAG: UDP-glucose 4-epimerase GalE [Betaproteobacteria bacterium]